MAGTLLHRAEMNFLTSGVAQVYPGAARYEQSRAAFESLFNAKAENVAGVGDRADYVGGTMSGVPTATVTAQRGQTPVTVQVIGGGPPARDQAIELTRILLARL